MGCDCRPVGRNGQGFVAKNVHSFQDGNPIDLAAHIQRNNIPHHPGDSMIGS
jgi:hypothetical protein